MIIRKSKNEFKVNAPLNSPVTAENIDEMRQWCTNIFGQGGRNKKCGWRYGWVDRTHNSFYFRTEKDALFFTLRWA